MAAGCPILTTVTTKWVHHVRVLGSKEFPAIRDVFQPGLLLEATSVNRNLHSYIVSLIAECVGLYHHPFWVATASDSRPTPVRDSH